MSVSDGDSAIYVADLAEYVDGNLVGKWITLDENVSGDWLREQIREFLDERGHEEHAIHDYDGPLGSLGGELGEYPDLDEVARHALMVGEHGQAWLDYVDNVGVDATEEGFEDAFCGQYKSGEEYAEEFFEECYSLDDLPPIVRWHIDWEGVWRDLTFDGYWISRSGNVFSG